MIAEVASNAPSEVDRRAPWGLNTGLCPRTLCNLGSALTMVVIYPLYLLRAGIRKQHCWAQGQPNNSCCLTIAAFALLLLNNHWGIHPLGLTDHEAVFYSQTIGPSRLVSPTVAGSRSQGFWREFLAYLGQTWELSAWKACVLPLKSQLLLLA